MTESNAQKFSGRADAYKRFRPTYPPEVLTHLASVGVLVEGAHVADIGAGTGILTGLLLDAGYAVTAVEPNADMAAALREDLGGKSGLRDIVEKPAEATGLGDDSVDVITVAQALHWFEPASVRREFSRICRLPHNMVALWNRRDTAATELLVDYEALLQKMGIGYKALVQRWDSQEAALAEFYGHGDYESFFTTHIHQHDWEGFIGRLFSSSYGPREDDPARAPVMAEMRRLFDAHERNGTVDIHYDCRVFYGPIRP